MTRVLAWYFYRVFTSVFYFGGRVQKTLKTKTNNPKLTILPRTSVVACVYQCIISSFRSPDTPLLLLLTYEHSSVARVRARLNATTRGPIKMQVCDRLQSLRNNPESVSRVPGESRHRLRSAACTERHQGAGAWGCCRACAIIDCPALFCLVIPLLLRYLLSRLFWSGHRPVIVPLLSRCSPANGWNLFR